MPDRWHPSKDRQTVTILNGYIRDRIDDSFYVPSDVQLVILSFIGYRFMYEGEYTWTIGNKLLQQMKNSKNKRKFLSGTFEINELEWQIEAYPNGYKPHQSDVGSFQIFLKLIHIPLSFASNKLIIFRRIYSKQIKSSYSRISQYVDGTSKGWADYCLSLHEIQNNSTLKQLTFTIQLQILRMMTQPESYHWHQLSETIYQNPIFYTQHLKQQSFQWIINGELMELMHNAYPGKQFESPIFNKMWCLNLTPNGAARKWKDYFDVFLVLCGLPTLINKIVVKWKICVAELNIETIKSYSFDFDKNNCNDCWSECDDEKVLSFKEFKLYNQVVFCLEIEILAMIDDNHNKLDEKYWDRYLVKGIQNTKTFSQVNDTQNSVIDQVMSSFGCDNAFQI